jgi:hypothetical protein
MSKVGRKYCRVCLSPYRGEIEELKKRGVNMREISNKYAKLFDVEPENMYWSVVPHFKKKHPPVLRVEPLPIEERKHISFDEYADMLLQEGAASLMTHPEKVSHGHVIAAKRTQIEEAKAKNAIDATKLLMLKFFRGNAIEGEVVDVKQIRGETLPTDTD